METDQSELETSEVSSQQGTLVELTHLLNTPPLKPSFCNVSTRS